MPTVCYHCQAPLGPGGAKGLCPRCYRWTRRHDGELPPRERTVSADLSTSLEVRMSALMLSHVKTAAKRAKLRPSAWVRGVVHEAVLRAVATKEGQCGNAKR